MKHILANGEPFLLKRGALEKDVLEELENIPSKTSDLTNDSEFISKPFYYGSWRVCWSNLYIFLIMIEHFYTLSTKCILLK